MVQQKWRDRLPPRVDADALINEITKKLQDHYHNGAITFEQLTKLLTLANNTAQLQFALTCL